MSDNKSIFSQDWRDCLEAHYKDVVRRNDTLTEDTLVGVLHSVGYRDDELQRIKLAATMRAEDLQADFVPQLDLDAIPEASSHTHEHDGHVHTHEGHTHPAEDVPADDEPRIFAGVELDEPEPPLLPADGVPLPEEPDALIEPVPLEPPLHEDEPALPTDTDDVPPPPADAPTQLSMF